MHRDAPVLVISFRARHVPWLFDMSGVVREVSDEELKLEMQVGAAHASEMRVRGRVRRTNITTAHTGRTKARDRGVSKV